MGSFEKISDDKIATPFGKKSFNDLEFKKPEKEKIKKSEEEKRYAAYSAEGKEKSGYYGMLRENLKDMQMGGVDLHFGQIDVDNLDEKALDLYRKYIKKKITESELRKFMEKTSEGSNDYNFAALLEHWIMYAKKAEVINEKNKLKGKALETLKKENLSRDVAEYLKEIFNKDILRKCDYEAFILKNSQSYANWQEKLRQHFQLEVKGNNAPQEITEKILKISNDPRYQYYLTLSRIQGMNPIAPEEFLGE